MSCRRCGGAFSRCYRGEIRLSWKGGGRGGCKRRWGRIGIRICTLSKSRPTTRHPTVCSIVSSRTHHMPPTLSSLPFIPWNLFKSETTTQPSLLPAEWSPPCTERCRSIQTWNFALLMNSEGLSVKVSPPLQKWVWQTVEFGHEATIRGPEINTGTYRKKKMLNQHSESCKLQILQRSYFQDSRFQCLYLSHAGKFTVQPQQKNAGEKKKKKKRSV